MCHESLHYGRDLPEGASFIEGDPKRGGAWQKEVAEHDLIVNLAGASIFTLWTPKARRENVNSRVLTTRSLVSSLAASAKETVLINASAVGHHGGHEDDLLLDETSPPGNDFLARVGREWEAEAGKAEDFGVRVALCRFGIILGREGGALGKMVPPFKYWLGSPLGNGQQWFPWIHLEDLFRIMLFLSEKKHLSGPFNCTAPSPVRNRELTRALANQLHKPLIMPSVPGFFCEPCSVNLAM